MSARSLWSLTLVLALSLAPGASADTKLLIRRTQGEMEVLGKIHPTQVFESTFWLGEERVRMDVGPLGFIVRFDQNQFRILDHSSRVYHTLKLPFVLRDHLPAELAAQFEIAEAFKPEVIVVDQEEARQIGKWKAHHCVGTLTTMGAAEQKVHIWALRDPAIDHALYVRAMAVAMSLAPIRLPVEELEGACGGFPVLRETQGELYGASFSLREELISAEVQEPPAGLYEPPADYRKKEIDGLGLIQLTPYQPEI